MGARAGETFAVTTQIAMASEQEAAELARVLEQIALEDPEGAADLRLTIGLPDIGRSAPSSNQLANTSGHNNGHVEGFGLEPSDDFDVETTFTIAVVGACHVGKTALLRRFTRGSFDEEYRKTLVADFIEKRIRLPSTGDEEAVFHFWDTPGTKDPAVVDRTSCKKAKACLIVFPSDDPMSVEMLARWTTALQEICGPDVLIVLASTKSDTPSAQAVSDIGVDALTKEHGLKHFRTSALDNTSVCEIFDWVGMELLKRAAQAEERFRSGVALGGLQWENAQSGSAAWTEGGSRSGTADEKSGYNK